MATYGDLMRLPLLIAGVLVATTALAPVARAAEDPVSLDAITVGDSVQLGAKWVLLKRGVDIVDAKVSRQARTGPELLLKRGKRLPRNVIIHLGTNGSYALEDCKDMVKIAGPDRRVFMMTISVPRLWEKVNNDTIRRCARAFPVGRVTIIDWKAATKAHPTWLYSDGVHLPPTGAKGYARLIVRAINAPE
jgi:hypothetical protein